MYKNVFRDQENSFFFLIYCELGLFYTEYLSKVEYSTPEFGLKFLLFP